jgi:hypothetical protein
MTRKIILVVALLAAFALTGCTSSDDPHIQPGEGPAETVAPSDAPTEGEPTTFEGEGEPGDPPSPVTVPSFHEKYVFDDGVEVEVTEIAKGHLTRKQAAHEYSDVVKSGMGWVRFTSRIKNGSKEILDTESVSAEVTYGPDGREAEQLTFNDHSDFAGKVLPGRAKTAEATFLIPERHWGDVVLEVSIGDEFERQSVIFVGSVR